MATDLARQQPGGALATTAPGNPWAEVGLLKPHAGGLVVTRPRVDVIATVSAGYRNADGNPVVSRDGTIYVSGCGADEAPGLRAALKKRGNKALTIALCHDNPADSFQQRFAKYSKTRVLSYGGAEDVTVFHVSGEGRNQKTRRETFTRAEHPDRFAQLAEDMKVQTSLYFTLAEWDDDGHPYLFWPDGFGFYRLRFTSSNSAESIRGALTYIAGLTEGRTAGIPLELAISYQDVSDPNGERRNVPVWTLRLNPPSTIRLEPGRVHEILRQGIEQVRMLALPAPPMETPDLALAEGPDVDLDAGYVIEGEVIERDDRPRRRHKPDVPITNVERCRSEYDNATRGTSLADEEGQRDYCRAWTKGRIGDLDTLIETATVREWGGFMEAVAERVTSEIEARQESDQPAPVRPQRPPTGRRGYADVFPGDELDAQPSGPPAAEAAPAAPPPVDAPSIASAPELKLPAEPEWMRSDERPQMLKAWSDWATFVKRLDPAYEVRDATKLNGRELVHALREMVGYARGIAEEPSDDEIEAPGGGDVGGQTDDVAF